MLRTSHGVGRWWYASGGSVLGEGFCGPGPAPHPLGDSAIVRGGAGEFLYAVLLDHAAGFVKESGAHDGLGVHGCANGEHLLDVRPGTVETDDPGVQLEALPGFQGTPIGDRLSCDNRVPAPPHTLRATAWIGASGPAGRGP